MNFLTFSFVTTVGSAVWCVVLAYLGDQAYRREPELVADPEALMRFVRGQSTWILVVVMALAVLYILMMRLSRPTESAKS